MTAQRPTRRELANAIRALSMDAVEAANSGHPGAPLGLADVAEVLWNDVLRFNPANPHWIDRDRFVLSNGHASMLLYSVLHLAGYDLPITEIQRFRQLHSRTPGHPERGETPGVETTTGPLGQGLANAVGLALAERLLGADFNRDDLNVVYNHTYVVLGYVCMMEGVSNEACSLAGTLGLGKLIALYDDNGISIDGEVRGWFADDTPARFEAYGWRVIRAVDGHDPAAVARALTDARASADRPTLICCRTVIGWGAPTLQGSADTHGSPLGAEEVARTRANLGWTSPPFVIPEHIYAAWDARARGAALERAWQEKFARYRARHPELARELERRSRGELAAGWSTALAAHIDTLLAKPEKVATRKASQQVLSAIAPALPELIGGSADLTGSNGTLWKAAPVVGTAGGGRYVHYGVREFAMSAIMNGLALHGGFVPFGGTFLVFSDYARNAVRLAALMGLRSIFVYSHDSIGLGEDGPTHQAIEHAASLRLMPNLHVWRPCDAVETAVAWRAAITRGDGPSALLLTRQNLPPVPGRDRGAVEAIARGGYVVLEPERAPRAIIIATGSEVALAIAAASALNAAGHALRVVSMPCTEIFDAQDEVWRERVLPAAVTARIAVEAGATAGWYRYVGLQGRVLGIDRFGLSAPGDTLFAHFGFSVEHLTAMINEIAPIG
ncbi:MAG: transketolase [Gammaproteobacteria bacterium]|nr:transketolase [Gammaproteobacteria bacterium]